MPISLILLDGTAPPSIAPELCVLVPWRPLELTGCFTSITEVQERYSTFDNMAKSFSEGYMNVFYAPLRDGLCIEDICGQTTSEGTPIWHDIGHITEKSSAELAPLLSKRLKENGFSQRFPWVPFTR